MNILGISAFYHDSAACLVSDGKIIAAAQEERFTRKKHDEAFPMHAAAYCLQAGGVGPRELDIVAYYEKPLTKFSRLLKTYLSLPVTSVRSFVQAMSAWSRQKLWIEYELEKAMHELGFEQPKELVFAEHHESHAASAFYPSPFQEAAILTLDAVGEWSTSSIGVGRDNQISLIRQLQFPHSLGMLYSAFTYFCGFKVNSGEYKLMGLAPYGEPRFVQTIKDNLLDIRADGSLRLNLDYFGYLGGFTMTTPKFAQLFGGPARKPETPITKREMDLAHSIQIVTEEIVLRMAEAARLETGCDDLCLAGGVALNCVANGRLQREGPFRRVWVQPAAGDAGGALGAALFAWHQAKGNARTALPSDQMEGSYLGPSFSDNEIRAYLDRNAYPYSFIADEKEHASTVAAAIAEQKVIGLFIGRMEYGPRALGHRSIIGDPRSAEMQSVMNLKIKYRESFRPFAPVVLEERLRDYFEFETESPYMLMVAAVKPELRLSTPQVKQGDDLLHWVTEVRSTLPAITHVDYSARLQTVTAKRNGAFYGIVKAFEEKTGCGVVINTSFNVRGEPIVNTPEDAYRCFMRTSMDMLVLGSCVLVKSGQPELLDKDDWRETFVLD